MLPFLRNSNDAVSSNDRYDVDIMTAVVPKLSNYVTHYASHSLRENFQFAAIYEIMQSMKTEPSVVYMVPLKKVEGAADEVSLRAGLLLW